METWLPVTTHVGLYEVSDQGRVRNVSTGRIMKARFDKYGYLKLNLSTPIRTVRIHRLVAEAHLPPAPSPEHVVDHKNHNRADPRKSNLCWKTQTENNAEYTPGAIRCIECGRACPNCTKKRK